MKLLNGNGEKILFWTPRILAILFILFLGIFALDAFQPGQPLFLSLGGFLMHLLPNFLLLIILLIAWKREVLGGAMFLLVIVFFTFFFGTYMQLMNFLLITFPIFLIGALFLFHHAISTHKYAKR